MTARSSGPGVDVVIPVYNGRDHVAACLESVLANTPGDDVRFIVADDASPDPEIAPLLAGFAERDTRVEVIRRPQNLGFVGNCNAAMAGSDRDVVILNADTLVPPGWLERMRRLAATSDRIATVTPLSNNGEVVSVPEWLTPNAYPEGVDNLMLDEIAQTVGTGEWIELPTAVGFAMYIRRAALDEFGLFDEARFGKGYGEENDLSCRFRHGGFLNLLCDDVFVAHVGGVSFAESGTGRLAENLETLAALWPDYHDTIQAYIRDNPLRGVQARFGRELLRRTKQADRLRILYVLHNPIHGLAIGGTEFQTEDLVHAAGDDADAVVLHVGARGAMLQWVGPDHLLAFPADEPGRRWREWVPDLLATGIDVVHIQHAMHLTEPDLRTFIDVTRDAGIPLVWSIHDYYTLCPGAQLLDAEDRTPCRSLGGGAPADCAGCARRAALDMALALPGWRSFYAEQLQRADALVAPSLAAAEVITSELPQLAGRFTVLAHGLRRSPIDTAPPRSAPPYGIGVLGYGGPHKGDRVIGALMEHLPGPDFVFHLFGRTELAEMPEDARAVFHGRYLREDIVRLLADADLSCVVLLSTWPETFSYTLSEAWAAGLPVFGADQGAIAERIRRDGGGKVISIEEGALAATAAEIRATLEDAAVLGELAARAALNGASLPTVADMWQAYRDLYRSLEAGGAAPADLPFPVRPTFTEMRSWLGHVRSPMPAMSPAPVRS